MKKYKKYLICLIICAVLSFLLICVTISTEESTYSIPVYITVWAIFSFIVFVPIAIVVFICSFLIKYLKTANKNSGRSQKNKSTANQRPRTTNTNRPTSAAPAVNNMNSFNSAVNTNTRPEIKPAKKYIYVPGIIGNKALIYKYYDIKFAPTNKAYQIARQMNDKNDMELNYKIDDSGKIHLEKYNTDMGVVLDRTDMINDWAKRNDLIRFWLSDIENGKNILVVAFYRDEQARLKHCDTNIVKLTNCYSEDSQMEITCLEKGVKLDFDDNYIDDYTDDDSVHIVNEGQSIGKLPKKYADKYLDEGAAAVFLDHVDYNNETDKETPYVIIYW